MKTYQTTIVFQAKDDTTARVISENMLAVLNPVYALMDEPNVKEIRVVQGTM